MAAKGQLPGGLEGLEEFIGLEESAQAKGVDKTECDEEEEGILVLVLPEGAHCGSSGRWISPYKILWRDT